MLSYRGTGQFTEPYVVCQLEMTVYGNTIHTDWIYRSNCLDVPTSLQAVDITAKATHKATFFAMPIAPNDTSDQYDDTSNEAVIYNKACYKAGKIMLQYIDTAESKICPPAFKLSYSRRFAALKPCKYVS